MKYNHFFKLFTLIFIFILVISPCFAAKSNLNILSEIEIEQSNGDSYSLNLGFKEKFKGNAFIQKNKEKSYFVYIPDTIANSSRTKVIYKNREDKPNVKIQIEEKPYFKGDSKSNYIRLAVDMKNDYSLKLLAKTVGESPKATPFRTSSLIFFAIIALFVFLLTRIYRLANANKNTKSFTAFPSSYLNAPLEYSNNVINETKTIQKPVLPKININKTIRTADKDSFSCFDIPLADDSLKAEYKFESTLKQTSDILKERTAKTKQTNPITKMYKEDASELSLPIVEDLKKIKKEKKEIEEKKSPELLSELQITPTKGFYLTTVDDTFALFGYTGDKVFLLQKFNDLSQINLQARFYDRQANRDMYILRIDNYKAMIEISDSEMRELAVL